MQVERDQPLTVEVGEVSQEVGVVGARVARGGGMDGGVAQCLEDQSESAGAVLVQQEADYATASSN